MIDQPHSFTPLWLTKPSSEQASRSQQPPVRGHHNFQLSLDRQSAY